MTFFEYIEFLNTFPLKFIENVMHLMLIEFEKILKFQWSFSHTERNSVKLSQNNAKTAVNILCSNIYGLIL